MDKLKQPKLAVKPAFSLKQPLPTPLNKGMLAMVGMFLKATEPNAKPSKT
jgi:hypothetical protein